MERKIPYLVIFRQNFEESYWHIRTLESVKVKRIHVKPKFVTKISIISVQLHKSLKKNDFIWNQYSWIFQISKFCAKVKILEFGWDQKCLIRVFLQKILSYIKPVPSNFCDCKIWCKKYVLKFGIKNTFLGVMGSSFEKLLWYLKSGHWILSGCWLSCRNENAYTLERNYFICVFLLWSIRKLLSYFQPSQICLVAKFDAKRKILKLETKKCVIDCVLGSHVKKLLPYLKSVPSDLSYYKFWWKNRSP